MQQRINITSEQAGEYAKCLEAYGLMGDCVNAEAAAIQSFATRVLRRMTAMHMQELEQVVQSVRFETAELYISDFTKRLFDASEFARKPSHLFHALLIEFDQVNQEIES